MTNPETIISAEIIPSQEVSGVARVWDRFEDITTIPRKTGSEQEIASYVIEWASAREHKTEVDNAGNLLILIPATKGLEKGMTQNEHIKSQPS